MFLRLLRVCDLFVVGFSAVVASHLTFTYSDLDNSLHFITLLSAGDALGILALFIGWFLIFQHFIRYLADRWVDPHKQLRSLAKAAVGSLIWFVTVYPLFWREGINAGRAILFLSIVISLGILSRVLLRLILLAARRSGYNDRYLLIVGASDRSYQLGLKINDKPELGYKIVGFVAENHDVLEAWANRGHENWKILGILANLRDVLVEARADEVMVCLPIESRFIDILNIVKDSRDLGIVVRLMPDPSNSIILQNLHIEKFEEDCVVTLFREQFLTQLMVKRLVDTVLSILVLVILSPMIVMVSLIIKLTSPGPVFFTQLRVGMNQRLFVLYKFRSMVAGAEQMIGSFAHLNDRDGPAFKIVNDPRITRVGRILRKTSLDELPQLLNVIRGEMSLVGPRPPLPEEVRQYAWLFRKRLSVKPGLTCIWQISGRNNVSFDRWMEMDHEYIENWSLWLDLKILLLTIPVVLLSKGAS